MPDYLVKEINNKETWENFVLANNPKSFLQSWNWGETNRLTGSKIYRLGFYNQRKLVGICLAIKQKAKRGTHLLIPGGPIINWKDKILVNVFIDYLKQISKREKAWFVRLRPELLDTKENRELLKEFGFISSPIHLHAENTWVLGIKPDSEQLLMAMRKSTRYLIRKSLKENLRLITTKDKKDTKILSELQKETVERHGFVGFNNKIFQAQLAVFGKDDQATMFICQKNNKNLAAAIIIFYGEYAYYHHSASSSKNQSTPSSYFLQWHIIQKAKEKGKKYYNFWGISPINSKNHRFAGVTLFKQGFGGERIDWLHAHDLVISPFYLLTYIFEIIRKHYRRL